MAWHKFLFDGLDSSEYGVFISGQGTFASPQRDVTTVSVPGRNGDLIIDNGRWKNVQLTYPAFIPSGFEDKFPSFRALMCQKRGYRKLEDDYNPEEYRLGCFYSALEPAPTAFNRSGDFNITFNCKPQRFLKNGDQPIQFLPVSVSGSTAYSHYIPIAGDLKFTVHCKSTDTLTVNVTKLYSESSQTGSTDYTCTNGTEQSITFGSSDNYFKLSFTGHTDLDATWLEISIVTEYDGVKIPVNAIMCRSWSLQNPTGYAAKPLIEVYGNRIPYIDITNYVGDEVEEYFSFHGNAADDPTRMWMDCEMQYVYDDDRNNLTSLLFMTTSQSAVGKALVFPYLGSDEISLQMYYTSSSFSEGIGLVNIYPRWWTL